MTTQQSRLQEFIGTRQLQAIVDGLQGEEASHFRAKIDEYTARIAGMPMTYATDGQGDNAVAYLHYFNATGWDWYITEKDADPDGIGQVQAFGYVCGWAQEWGYINIPEILTVGAELDLYWEPITVRAALEKWRARR